MTVTVKVLIDAQQAPAVETALYTSPPVSPNGGKGTIVDKFTADNTTGGAVTITVHLVKVGGAAGAANAVVTTQSIAAGAAYTFPEIVGHVLGPGDFISLIASAAGSLTVRASGRELT